MGEVNQELEEFLKNLHWLGSLAKLSLEENLVQDPESWSYAEEGNSESCPFRHGCHLNKFVSQLPKEADDVVKFGDMRNKVLPVPAEITTKVTTWVSCCQTKISTCYLGAGYARRVEIPNRSFNQGYWGIPSWSTASTDSLGFTWGAYYP